MKKFMAIFVGTPNSEAARTWESLSETAKAERERAGMEAWMKWATDNAASILDHGAPLGKTKRIDLEGITSIRNELCAYALVQAESHEAAAKLFRNHPHFTFFPGDAVEVMECLPMPTL